MSRGAGTATGAAADRIYVGSNPTPGCIKNRLTYIEFICQFTHENEFTFTLLKKENQCLCGLKEDLY